MVINDPQEQFKNNAEKPDNIKINVERSQVSDFNNSFKCNEQLIENEYTIPKYYDKTKNGIVTKESDDEQKSDSSFDKQEMFDEEEIDQQNKNNEENNCQNDKDKELNENHKEKNHDNCLNKKNYKIQDKINHLNVNNIKNSYDDKFESCENTNNKKSHQISPKSNLSNVPSNDPFKPKNKTISKSANSRFANPEFDWVVYIKELDLESDLCKIPYCKIDKEQVVCKKKLQDMKFEMRQNSKNFGSDRDIKIQAVINFQKALIDRGQIKNLNNQQQNEIKDYLLNRQNDQNHDGQLFVNQKSEYK